MLDGMVHGMCLRVGSGTDDYEAEDTECQGGPD